MNSYNLGHVIMIIAVAALVSFTLRKHENTAPKNDRCEKPSDIEDNAAEKSEIVSNPKNNTVSSIYIESETDSIGDGLVWLLQWFILKPLFWIAYVAFFIGSLASLFTTIANIIHFNILSAVGFFLLYLLLWNIWKVLEMYRMYS